MLFEVDRSLFDTKLRSLKRELKKIEREVHSDFQHIETYGGFTTTFWMIVYEHSEIYKHYKNLQKQVKKFQHYIKVLDNPDTKQLDIQSARQVDLKQLFDIYNIPRRRKMYFCPFHNDVKNPNMSIHPRKNTFKCFACGVGGSPIDFVMLIDQLSFVDAVKSLEGICR